MSQSDREKWDERYRGLPEEIRPPERFLVACQRYLPASGRALDLAGGDGRNALWLAEQGLDATIADISEVGLARARAAAARRGLELETVAVDLETAAAELEILPMVGPFDVVTSFFYYWPGLFAVLPRMLAPGGTLIYAQPTKSNLLRHSRPPVRFLLDDGQLATLAAGLEIVSCEEGWFEEGRHEARLVARRKQGE